MYQADTWSTELDQGKDESASLSMEAVWVASLELFSVKKHKQWICNFLIHLYLDHFTLQHSRIQVLVHAIWTLSQ